MELLTTTHDAVTSIQVLRKALDEEAATPRLLAQVHVLLGKGGLKPGIGRDELAKEIVQDSLSKALEIEEKYDPQLGSVNAWLHGIANYLVRDRLRQQQRLPRQFSSNPEEWEHLLSKSEDHCQKVCNSEFLDSLKQQLSTDEQELIHLRYTENLDYKAIANRLSMKPGTVRIQWFRLLARLQLLANASRQEGSS